MKIFNLILFFSISFFSGVKENNTSMTDAELERFNTQLEQVKTTINTAQNCNTKIAFFVDMRIKSGKNRFFVYDLVNNKIIDQGLVANGSGSETKVREIISLRKNYEEKTYNYSAFRFVLMCQKKRRLPS